MSVPNIVPIVRYSGTGEQKEFYIPFPYLDKADLVVRSSLNGAMSEADYEVNGKYITFVNAPADKEVIAILRNTVVERIADYDDTGAVSASSLNNNFDRPLLTIQEIEEVLSRCVQMDPTSGETPEGYLDKVITITENAKDVSLNAAVSAANSAQSAATSERNIGLIWAEITGDTSLADNALLTLKEAAEATGAITAAKELAVGEIRNTGAIAVAATEKAADEAREAADIAANTAGSISQTVADQITIQVSQAAGANGILGVAIETGKNVVESARQEAYDKAQEALNKINAGNREFTDQSNAAIIQIQGKVDSVAIDVQAAIEKAQIIAGNYLKNAQATVSGSIADLEQMKQQAGSDTELIALINKRIAELQELQGYLTDAESAKTAAENFSQAASSSAGSASSSASNANASAGNAASKAAEALQSAQSAATSASNAAASAVAASTTATEVSNQLLTVHNASTEAHPGIFLKASGGWMRGTETSFSRENTTGRVNFLGGTIYENGGWLAVFGEEYSDFYENPRSGGFELGAGENLRLVGRPDGTLIWGNVQHGKNIVRRVDGVNADAAGNVTLNALPKSGGQMSGNINRTSDAARFIIAGATDYTKGAHLCLDGKDYYTNGVFVLNACNGEAASDLRGQPDGSLLWNRKHIVRSVDGVAADANGNVALNVLTVVESWRSEDGYSWYRKYSDGWIEQGGVVNTFIAFTFPAVFQNTNYTIAGAYRNNNGAGQSLGFDNLTTTGARAIGAYSHDGNGYNYDKDCDVCWYACGF